MRFGVEVPAGWTRTPFPAPQRGLYLHPPPGGPRGAMLLMDAITAAGTLLEQLEAAVRTGCAGTELLSQGEPIPFATIEYPGVSIATRVKVTWQGQAREEIRVFSMIDAGPVRLPVVFVGEVGAAQRYWQPIGLILATIRSDKASEP
jgi:hypothetical protein